MRNLLHNPPDEAELCALLEATQGAALPPLGAGEWALAARREPVAAWLDGLHRRAEQDAFRPLPRLTDELYSEFHDSGGRLSFEKVYFERRRLLGRVALAVLLSGGVVRERMLPALVEKIRDIAGEPSWALPAHVEAPSGKDVRVLDLFAAETANLLAEMLVVFGAVIPPDLAGRIRARLRRDVFETYVEGHGELRWFRAGMNWNAVCHQGIVGAALAVERDTVLLARMLRLVAEGLPHFLAGFGADGSTSEGPGYWQYGFGWFAELNAQLEARTERRLSLINGDAKVAKIAHFAPHLTLRNGYWVNFSDNDRRGALRASLLVYLATRLRSAALSVRAAEAYQRVAREGVDLDDQRADFFHLSRLVLRSPDRLVEGRVAGGEDVFFPHYGAVVARGEDAHGRFWEFAAKAGNNAEHHNHNDCGSFILHMDGVPVVMEIGAPEYVRDYFGDRRYSFLAARSAGHSVPLVNGHEQAAGTEFAATVIKCEMTERAVVFVMDLARCYPAAARCRRLIRTLHFEKQQGRLTVTDVAEFDGEGVLESLLISESPVTVWNGRIELETAAGRQTVTSCGTPIAMSVDTPEYRNRFGDVASIQRLRLVTCAPAKVVTVGFSIEPADHGRKRSSQLS